MIVTNYLINLTKRAATGEHVYPVEIAKLPQVIDKAYGDGDGTLEFSDVADAATEIGGEMLDKASHVIDILGSIF